MLQNQQRNGHVAIQSQSRGFFAQRWAGFVVAIWLMIFSGSYGFSNYSTALKQVLGLNQKQLNRLSVAKDLGDSLGIIAGILCNYLPPWALLCIGSVIGFVGYGTQWLVVSQIISPLPYWTIFICVVMGGNCISWMNASVFTVSVRNFPRNRGPVVGLFKAYMGLSAALYSNICDAFLSSSSSKYLFMMMTLPPAFCLVAALFFKPVPSVESKEEDKAEQQTVSVLTVIACLLALNIMMQDFLPSLKEGVGKPVVMSLSLILLLTPALVPFIQFCRIRTADINGDPENINGLTKPLLENQDESSNEIIKDGSDSHIHRVVTTSEINGEKLEEGEEEEKDNDDDNGRGAAESRFGGCCSAAKTELGKDTSTLSLFKTWHFYALYFALFCGAGSGMAFANNLGQVSQSFGYSTATIFTSLFSLGNFMGRILSGNISEYTLRLKAVPRSAWMGIVKVPMLAMFALLSFGAMGGSLYGGSLILGLCHGSLITLTIPTVSEFYGLKYFGTNFMVMNTHLLAGSSVLSGVIAGYLYDEHANYDESSGSYICYGSSCYGTTFLIYVGLLTFALLFDAILTFISRPLYLQIQKINTHHMPSKKH